MKITIALSFLALLLLACGPTPEEVEMRRQDSIRLSDSLNKVERDKLQVEIPDTTVLGDTIE
jgi:starvation-inducible outer membrane lipoprotein